MSRLLCVLVVSLGLVQCALAQEQAQADAPASDSLAVASAPDSASASSATQIHAISEMLTQKFGLARAKAEQISQAVMSSASKYALPPSLVLAIISIESRFKEKARGLHGATGLMQVVPAAHRQLVKHLDLTAPEDNIEAGSAILHGYLESAQGDVGAALKSYGGSKAYAEKVSLRAKDFQLDAAASGTTGSSDATGSH
jgi:soluble lytic murein transglycosylase-like protein